MNSAAKINPVLKLVLKLWAATQVSHRGMYSIERTLALQEYTHSTSRVRALVIAICTPAPVLLGSLIIESLPLYEPSAGWIVNYSTWIRTAALAALLAFLIALDVRHLMPGWPLSRRQVAIFPFIVVALHMPVVMLLAAFWVYPIPFMTVVSSGPFTTFCGFTLWFMIGKSGVDRLNRDFPGAFARHSQYTNGQSILVIIYPSFQAFFNSISHSHYTLPVLVLMLPCIKIILKQVAARQSAHLEDLIPELVVVSVELFNALYLATCIQRISSPTSALLIFLIDVLQNVVALRGIYERTAHVFRRHCALKMEPSKLTLLAAAHDMITTPRQLGTQKLSGIQLRSCVPHKLSVSSNSILTTLEQGQLRQFVSPRVRGRRHIVPHIGNPKQSHQPTLSMASIVPIGSESTPAPAGPNALAVKSSKLRIPNPKSMLLADSQSSLFAIEYYVLAEYYELLSQLFYAGYLAGLSRLPVAKYHAELTDISNAALSQTLINNVLFSFLKLASLIALLLVLHRACGHNGLAHLSFVLETRMLHIQTKMMVWILMVMGFRVVHFGKAIWQPKILDRGDANSFLYPCRLGVDFSFKFAWMHKARTNSDAG